MSFPSFIRILARSWWIVALALAVVIGSAAYFTYRQTPVYEASASLVIKPAESVTGPNEIIHSLNALDRRSVVATFARIPASDTSRKGAQEQLGLAGRQMRSYRSRTTVVPDTNILRVSVEGPDPRLAAEVANAIARRAQDDVKEFYSIYELKVLDPATESSRPVRPLMARNLSVGFVLGLLLGVGLALLAEYLRRLKKSPSHQAEAESGAEVYSLQG